MSLYSNDLTPDEEKDFRNKQYIYRILYDIGYGAGGKPMDAYQFIRPTCEDFLRSSEYNDSKVGLYEAVDKYIKSHDWSEEVPINTLSEDYRVFEDFVSAYNQFSAEGKEFTIDDKCFDKGLRNKFIISLSDTEIEQLGLDKYDRDACKEKILSILRGESIAGKDLVFLEDKTVITDIRLPSESNDSVNAVVLCEDEIYLTCLNRVSDVDSGVRAADIANNAELRLSINKQIEYGGIALGMEYKNDYYSIPLSNNEASALYDLTNREVLCKFATSIPQYFEDLENREDNRAAEFREKLNESNVVVEDSRQDEYGLELFFTSGGPLADYLIVCSSDPTISSKDLMGFFYNSFKDGTKEINAKFFPLDSNSHERESRVLLGNKEMDIFSNFLESGKAITVSKDKEDKPKEKQERQ